ncbi:MAG: hypothetical protein IPK13_06545 [Deltaproteobacteria bacterium]|nr:hypothetical protein [Deltaproteobacteria bacterium]
MGSTSLGGSVRWFEAAAMVLAAVSVLAVGGHLGTRTRDEPVPWGGPARGIGRGAPGEPGERAGGHARVDGVEKIAQSITTLEAPLDVQLESGIALHLAPNTRIAVLASRNRNREAETLRSRGGETVQLDYGEVDVRRAWPSTWPRTSRAHAVTVTSPHFVAVADSADFSVSYRAGVYSVLVREGAADVRGEGLSGSNPVKQGERRLVVVADPDAAAPDHAASEAASPRAMGRRDVSPQAVEPQPAGVGVVKASAPMSAPASAPMSMSISAPVAEKPSRRSRPRAWTGAPLAQSAVAASPVEPSVPKTMSRVRPVEAGCSDSKSAQSSFCPGRPLDVGVECLAELREGQVAEQPAAERPAAEGQTVVHVERANVDRIAVDSPSGDREIFELWSRATDAYYRERDLPTAIHLAEQVVAADILAGPEGWLAQRLLCEAYVADGQPLAAIRACTLLLRNPSARADEIRQVHYMIATILRAHLEDCDGAIQHYDRAIVFGGTSVMDDEVRFFRATCAIRTGRFDLARSDLASLKVRAATSARPKELIRLESMLREAETR